MRIVNMYAMKISHLISLGICLLFWVACQDRETNERQEEKIPEDNWNADDAMMQWRNAWNDNDADALEAVTADDAVLFMNGKVHREDSISNWIKNSSSWMADLNTSTIAKKKGTDFAYEAGSYTHKTTENDTTEMSGTYTVVWERTANQKWRIKVMDISPVMEQDSIALED